MSKGRSTTVITVRFNDDDLRRLKKRADRKGMLFTEYIKWVLFRNHHVSCH